MRSSWGSHWAHARSQVLTSIAHGAGSQPQKSARPLGGGRGIARAGGSPVHTDPTHLLSASRVSVPHGGVRLSCAEWSSRSVPYSCRGICHRQGTAGDTTPSEQQPPSSAAGPYFPSQKPQRQPRQPLRIWREASTISAALTSSSREKRTTFQATTPTGSRQVLQV